MDFAALPPEVNSGRMYTGPGAGPLLAAASAWDSLASELSSAAASYQGLVSELTGEAWRGPASSSMAAASAPYAAWMASTAGQAEQAASQARSAALAYESAFAATVPPPVVAANRALLTSLVATNFLGQNAPAIAATETHYAEMWAQDAAAMYGYAAGSAAATTLTPFTEPQQTTNPAGMANQSAAVGQAASNGGVSQAVSSVPNALQAMATGTTPVDPVTSIMDWLYSPLGVAVNNFTSASALPMTNLTGPMFGASGALYQIAPLFMAGLDEWSAAVHAMPEAALGAGLMSSSESMAGVGAGVSAGLGEAASVGGLSVPQSWASVAPEVRLAAMATAVPGAGSAGAPAVGTPGMFGGIPPVGSVVNAPGNGEGRSRYAARAKVVAAIGGAPGAHDESLDRWMSPAPRRLGEDPLSDREREELAKLREELVDVAAERDAAARLIREAIRR